MALAIHGGDPVLPQRPPTWPLQVDGVLFALLDAWKDGSWGRYQGPHLEQLTAALAEMHGLSYALTCCSGTFAVELALRGLGITADDEVILAGYDFGGNFRAIEAIDARPVLVDIDRNTWCLDVSQVTAAISSATRAVVVSHLHGGVADMKSLRAIADQHRLSIVEDVCQCPGATVQGRIAGTWGDVGVLSFGGSKLLTAGRGGAIVTNREDVFQRAKIYGQRGNDAFPLSEIQAVVLAPQLPALAERNATRRANVERLLAQFADLPVLRPVRNSVSDSKPGYYKVAFEYVAEHCAGWSRDEFLAAIQAENVPIDVGFRGFTRRGVSRCRHAGSLENSRRAAETTVVLHHPILLEPWETVQQIAVGVRKVMNGAANTPRS